MANIDAAKLLAQQMIANGGPIGVRPMTLVKVTPGARTVGAPSSGNNPTDAPYDCYGWSDSSSTVMPGTLVRVVTKKISILGGSLDDGIEPSAIDKIIDSEDGLTYRIAGGVSNKSNGCVFECQCIR